MSSSPSDTTTDPGRATTASNPSPAEVDATIDAGTERVNLDEHPVLFFDGVCGLCDRVVGWIIRHDPEGRIRFAPLQGETAKALLPSNDAEELKSVVLLTPDGSYRKSSAIVRVLRKLGGVWGPLGHLLWIIPKPLRDWGYHFVSKIRYRIFGRVDLCRLPAPGEVERFLP